MPVATIPQQGHEDQDHGLINPSSPLTNPLARCIKGAHRVQGVHRHGLSRPQLIERCRPLESGPDATERQSSGSVSRHRWQSH
jgi:hypothetical protein